MAEIQYKFVEPDAFGAYFKEKRSGIFAKDFDFKVSRVMSREELDRRYDHWQSLSDLPSYHLVALDGEELVGWSFGIQRTDEDFYMTNSAVFPEHRRKGIYTKLLNLALERIKEMGFQRVFSRHKQANNPVLIAKLKAGFVISGMDTTDEYGPMLILSKYLNPRRQELLEVRMGTRKPSKEDLDLFE